jgi:maltose-binding protein MalE
MNKKLFSWKALAGLALLVAMGMTSCKNTTEVDPNDPYNTKTPTQPCVISGTADLTVKIAVPSDFANLWKNSVKDDVKKAIAKKDEITVVVSTSGMKLAEKASAATNTLTLPDFFNGATDKVVNLVLDGAFAETKSGLIINTASLAGDVINVTLPGNAEDGAYDLTTKAATTSMP